MELERTDSSCDRGDRVRPPEARYHEGAAGGWAPCSHIDTSRGLSSTTDRVQGEAPRSRTRAVCFRDRNRRIDGLSARLAHVPRARMPLALSDFPTLLWTQGTNGFTLLLRSSRPSRLLHYRFASCETGALAWRARHARTAAP